VFLVFLPARLETRGIELGRVGIDIRVEMGIGERICHEMAFGDWLLSNDVHVFENVPANGRDVHDEPDRLAEHKVEVRHLFLPGRHRNSGEAFVERLGRCGVGVRLDERCDFLSDFLLPLFVE